MAAKKKQESKAENIEFSAEISKVLKLMIHSLYTNKDIFLRELISNASDACDKIRYQAVTDAKILGDDADLGIHISSNPETNSLTITDNGIGMNREDLIENLGTIARSGTLEFFGNLSGDSQKDSALIGQFGVGFYSAFMVADKVEVTSSKAGDKDAWKWESDGEGSFTIEPADAAPRGTSITLYLKDEEKEFADKFRIKHIVNTYSDHIAFPITQSVDGEDEGEEPEVINDGSALWTRQQSEITEEQYSEFYHHVAHSPDEPFMTLHNKAEGAVEYTNLLFIPSAKPFDLFHPERRRRVKLYVKRVFITDENVEVIPAYLRFVRGIIDSQDLPLNISRETLQDNPLLRKIRESITSKVLGELAKKAKKDPEGYLGFWENFGAALKEGLCEALPEKERDKLLKVCRFTVSGKDELISLEQYVEMMKENQEEIFYATGDSIESLHTSPQLEGFISRDVPVLLMADHVDDFWINVIRQYDKKQFKSITRSDIDLSNFDTAATKKETEAKKSDDKTKIDDDKIENLITLLKTQYGEDIKDVRTTHKLTDTPACLSVGEGDMDARMERFLMEHKQLNKRAAKILEINPTHPLISLLAETVSSSGASDDISDAAQLLLDQAKIVEGESIEDAAGFSKRLSKFMQKAIAA